MGGQVELITPGVAIDDANTPQGLRHQEGGHLAPPRGTVIKGFAGQQQAVFHVVKLIEAATQALLMSHEQVTVQRHHAQTQVAATGNDKLGMLHVANGKTIVDKRDRLTLQDNIYQRGDICNADFAMGDRTRP